MANPVLLNNVDHHDLGVLTGHGAHYGDDVNETVVFATEFEELQREYPILFRRDPDGVYCAVALLGLDADENLFLDEDSWRGRYVPALLQRGPFSIGVPQRGSDGEPLGEPLIHVDLDHPRIMRGGGERVFLSKGGNAPYLDQVARVLQAIYAGVAVGKPMFAAFEAHGLLEPVDIDIAVENRKYVVPDCYTVSEARLMQLDGAALAQLHAADFLRPAIWAVSSLRNIGRLVDLKTARGRAA